MMPVAYYWSRSFLPRPMIRAFSRDPAVIAFGSDYLKIVSFNFIAAGIALLLKRFQGIRNTFHR
jgi:Na+-driven multidrug efflux pump